MTLAKPLSDSHGRLTYGRLTGAIRHAKGLGVILILTLNLLLFGAGPATAQTVPRVVPQMVSMRTRQKSVKFRRECPEATAEAIAAKLGLEPKALASAKLSGILKQERFRVLVPKSYKKSVAKKKPWGLLVWISPNGVGAAPPIWEAALEKARLLSVAPEKAGNAITPPRRMALALHARHNMLAKYEIDPERVIIGGFSGGGQISSWLTLHWPKAFPMGFYLGGCDYFRNVPMPDGGGRAWRGSIVKPKEGLETAKTAVRHLYIAGTKDSVLPQMKAVEKLAREDGFKRTALVELPGLGHSVPDAKIFQTLLARLEKL